MFLPPINSSPRVSSQKSSFCALAQQSRFAKGSIEINSATSQTDSPKLNVVDTPKTLRRMSCMSTLTPIDPANSPFKASSPGSTQSSISAISNSGTVSNSGPVNFKLTTRRNSSLSFKCLESLTKNKRMSIQLNPNQIGDLYAQNDSIILEQAKEEGDQIHSSTKKDAEKLNEMASLEKTSSSIQVLKDAEKAFELADQVFTAYGIHARPYTDFSSDSAMTLLPITNKRKLANFYRLFIPEMRRFNFTFLSNLRVGAISICESLKFSDKHHSIIEKKLYSGLFVLDRHMDETTVQQHWFRVVLFHFLKAVPEFFEEWCDLIKEDPKKKRRTAFEELLTTFNHLMGTSQKEWNQDIYLRTRVTFLDEALRGFDFDPKDPSIEESFPDVLKLLALWR